MSERGSILEMLTRATGAALIADPYLDHLNTGTKFPDRRNPRERTWCPAHKSPHMEGQ